MKINTSKWKKFKIEDLFSIKKPSARSQSNYDEGEVPFVASGNYNNGVLKFLTPQNNEQLDKGNCITVSPVDGSAFYQKDDFLGRGGAGSSILILYNDKLNLYNGYFISAVIKTLFQKYHYADMLNGSTIKKEIINLPATSDNQPDWEYMESYMKNIIEDSKNKLENLKNTNKREGNIKTEHWQFFACNKLFTAKNAGNILARDIIDGSGDTAYVTASGINNGVVAHIDASKYDIIPQNCILIGGKTFAVTYQAKDFVSNDSHNFVIRTKTHKANNYIYKFLVTIIKHYFGQKYSWNDAVTKDKFLSESIPLPVTNIGEPDWEYMESYMKNILNEEQTKLNRLKTCI